MIPFKQLISPMITPKDNKNNCPKNLYNNIRHWITLRNVIAIMLMRI